MRRASTATTFVFAAVGLGACQPSGSSSFLAPGANYLDFAPSSFRLAGDHLIGLVLEGNGVDLNGDGDDRDGVLETIDLGTGRRTVLPYAVDPSFQVGAGFLSFTVVECGQGEDLDGDGDVDCAHVPFVHELASGRTTNLGFALEDPRNGSIQVQDGALLAFVASEALQQRDLDGDGLHTHDLIYTYDAALSRLEPTGLRSHLLPIVSGERVLVAAAEDGLEDLNGDGDGTDSVLFVHDALTGANESLGRAVQSAFRRARVAADGALVALCFSESDEGGQDLNDDGDAQDLLLEIHDLELGTTELVNPPVSDFFVGGGLVALYVPESDPYTGVETDWNANGEGADQVVFLYDSASGVLTNTALMTAFTLPSLVPPVFADRRAAFAAWEAGQVDLNGDGDESDQVLELFDARTGGVTSLGVALSNEPGALASDEEHIACAVLGQHGAPGAAEPVATVVDWQSGALRDVLDNAYRLELAGRWLLVSVLERTDLDGDGDEEDIVLELVDLATGRLTNTGLVVTPHGSAATEIESDGSTIAVPVFESEQHRDLNRDGDQEDVLLTVLRLP